MSESMRVRREVAELHAKAVRLRDAADEAARARDAAVARALADRVVSGGSLAEVLGVGRQRVYDMQKAARARGDA